MPPVLPWYAPNQHELQIIALVMHYLTTQEANGYGVDDHTSNSLRTLGHLRSHCWQLIRQSIGDKAYFTNSIKLEVCPVAFPYGKKIDDVFANQDEISRMMEKYAVFVKSVIDSVTKVHLCSKAVAAKVQKMYGGASSFKQYFLENRDRFFSLSEEMCETCCHPEALLNRGYWNQHTSTKHASGWDRIFTMMRLFCGDVAACTEADDMVDLKPGTAAHTLMMQKMMDKHIKEEAAWCAKFEEFKVVVNKLVVRMYLFPYECVDRYSLQINYLSVVCKRLMDAAPIILISRQQIE